MQMRSGSVEFKHRASCYGMINEYVLCCHRIHEYAIEDGMNLVKECLTQADNINDIRIEKLLL